MSTLYQFPEMDSNFLNLYNRFAEGGSDFGQFLQPNDPELQAYIKKTQEPTGSEQLLRDYVNRRPTHENYEPSLGRKMAAVLIGAIAGGGNSGRAYELAQQHTEAPFRDMMDDWKTEGANIGSTARLMDADRARELAGMKYGLQAKATSRRNEISQTFKQEQEARRLAEITAAEKRNEGLDADRVTQRDFMNDLRTDSQKRANEAAQATAAQQAFNRGMTIERDKDRDEALAAKSRDLGLINKRLSDHASQLGVNPENFGSALDIANQVAMSKAVNYKFFDGLIDNKSGTFAPNFNGKDPQKVKLLTDWIQTEVQKLLKGEGY